MQMWATRVARLTTCSDFLSLNNLVTNSDGCSVRLQMQIKARGTISVVNNDVIRLVYVRGRTATFVGVFLYHDHCTSPGSDYYASFRHAEIERIFIDIVAGALVVPLRQEIPNACRIGQLIVTGKRSRS